MAKFEFGARTTTDGRPNFRSDRRTVCVLLRKYSRFHKRRARETRIISRCFAEVSRRSDLALWKPGALLALAATRGAPVCLGPLRVPFFLREGGASSFFPT